jgi:integrase
MEVKKKEPKWVKRWKSWIAAKPSKPGVWRRKEGGFLIRGRAVDPRTGKTREVRKTLPDADAPGAYRVLDEELEKVRHGGWTRTETTRFDAYAVLLLARKVATGEVKSAKTREKWGDVLEHHLFPAFGHLLIDQIRRADVEGWKAMIGKRVQAKQLSPNTANGWLSVLKSVMNSAVGELELERNPVMGVKPFDTSTHHTYTEEEPNALTVAEVPAFLVKMRQGYPQFFAMTAMGFATGLRPSSLRPLRRKGPTPDLLWEDGVMLVRRSHTRRKDVMETTKTKRHQRLELPQELMDILRWHVDELQNDRMRESDLLFPSRIGGFHAENVLVKPFTEVVKSLKLGKKLTPRGMRRTFQDLARAAEVKDVVTRAVSGHATEVMQRHYSTVGGQEIREGIAKVVLLARVREAMTAAPEPVEKGAGQSESGVLSGVLGSEMKKAS